VPEEGEEGSSVSDQIDIGLPSMRCPIRQPVSQKRISTVVGGSSAAIQCP
jgi:hypothetical protein